MFHSSRDRTHQICSCQPLENGAMNRDSKNVGYCYLETTCAWSSLLRLRIIPWLDQHLDLVY